MIIQQQVGAKEELFRSAAGGLARALVQQRTARLLENC